MKNRNNKNGGAYTKTLSQLPKWSYGYEDEGGYRTKKHSDRKVEVRQLIAEDEQRCAFIDKVLRERLGEEGFKRFKVYEKERRKEKDSSFYG